MEEAKQMTEDPDFKGYIHDVGGPTANFRHPACEKQLKKGVCQNRQCLFPKPCQNLQADHKDYVDLLRKLRKIPKVKKVFIRSGIRFDYLMADKDETLFPGTGQVPCQRTAQSGTGTCCGPGARNDGQTGACCLSEIC